MRPYSDPQPEPSWLADEEAAIARSTGWLVESAGTGRLDAARAEQQARALAERTMTVERLQSEPGARRRIARLRRVLAESVRFYATAAAAKARAKRIRALGPRRVRPLARARGAGRPRALRRIARRATCRGPDPGEDEPAAGHQHASLAGPGVWYARRNGWRP